MKIYNSVEEFNKEYNSNNTTLEELNLSFQAYSCFKKSGIAKIRDFKEMTVVDLLEVKGLNKNILDEVLIALKPFGIELIQEKIFY